VPVGEGKNYKGRTYTRYVPCPDCDGSGNQARWISLQEFAELLRQAVCPHKHVSAQGGMHFSAGDVWDDIVQVCSDCGANLDQLTLGDLIQDEE
jgi:hypothetical protein